MRTFKEIYSGINPFNDGREKAMDGISFNGDIYAFGVWSGASLFDLTKYLKANNIEYNRMYGFDSFIGLPEETPNIEKYNSFMPGNYSSVSLYNETDIGKIMAEMCRGINNDKLRLIDGFFEESLNDDLIMREGLKPASFIDVDVDLHKSTKTALWWMFDNKLIVPGTMIYFDDWGSTTEYEGGESLAWCETVNKYDVLARDIYNKKIGESEVCVMEIICVNG
jgi:hypothetical protein